jgi:hypothetical protein
MAAPAAQKQDDSCLVTITYGVLKAGGSRDSEYGIFIIDPALQPIQVGGGDRPVQKAELGMCVLPSWLLVDSHTRFYSALHSLLVFSCSHSSHRHSGPDHMHVHALAKWSTGIGLHQLCLAALPCSALLCRCSCMFGR